MGVFLTSFLLVLIMISSFPSHYVNLLLSLEFLMASVLVSLFLTDMAFSNGMLFLLFLSVFVCEGAMGLSLMISFSRGMGSDLMMLHP